MSSLRSCVQSGLFLFIIAIIAQLHRYRTLNKRRFLVFSSLWKELLQLHVLRTTLQCIHDIEISADFNIFACASVYPEQVSINLLHLSVPLRHFISFAVQSARYSLFLLLSHVFLYLVFSTYCL